jgi:hypothetical protein
VLNEINKLINEVKKICPSTLKTPKNSGLQPNVIQGFLKLKNISQLELARKGGVTEACISRAIAGESASRQIRSLIAERLPSLRVCLGKESRKAHNDTPALISSSPRNLLFSSRQRIPPGAAGFFQSISFNIKSNEEWRNA